MIRVQLVVTGRSERAALHTSLERACRVFSPRVEFVFLEPQYVDSFTSGSRALTPPLPDDPVKKDPARKLADAVIAALVDGRRKNERADYAFAVDDLEVPNAANANGVVKYFATHMERALLDRFGSSQADQTRRQRVRERASFHLLAPMLEAYFFASTTVLEAAGAVRPSVFDAMQSDLESFSVDDSAYSEWCVGQSKLLDWCCRHPKLYVKYLCSPQRYRETREGKAALDVLSWRETVARAEFTRFARSMLDDLVEALSPGAELAIQGDRHPLTERTPGRFLRNIDA